MKARRDPITNKAPFRRFKDGHRQTDLSVNDRTPITIVPTGSDEFLRTLNYFVIFLRMIHVLYSYGNMYSGVYIWY